MASQSPITPVGHFNAAFNLFIAVAGLRGLAADETESDAIEALVQSRFDAMVETPARGLHDIADKAEAIIKEYGELDAIPTDFVVAILRDVRGMIQ